MTSPTELLHAAAKARQQAYAPYSGFCVGAAVACDDGTIITGCNVENASYGLAICAERNAVFAAVAGGHRVFQAVAVVADGPAPPATPCGACRQVLAEFCAPGCPVYCATADRLDTISEFTLEELLPHTFNLKGKPL